MGTPEPIGPQDVEQTLERLHSFAERLMSENARLRQALAKSHSGTTQAVGEALADTRIQELEGQLGEARERAASLARGGATASAESERSARLERELDQARRRIAELEEQSNNLANLYVASYQLHSTLDFQEVVAVVMEIVINLIGAQEFCLMLLDGRTEELAVISAEGMEHEPSLRIPLGQGVIGHAAREGQNYYRPSDAADEVDFLHPIAAVPLRIKDHVIGLIAVYALFPQKKGFTSVDYELFNLLAGHAATAIFSAKLYSESERKLSTIQSFLDLLTTS